MKPAMLMTQNGDEICRTEFCEMPMKGDLIQFGRQSYEVVRRTFTLNVGGNSQVTILKVKKV